MLVSGLSSLTLGVPSAECPDLGIHAGPQEFVSASQAPMDVSMHKELGPGTWDDKEVAGLPQVVSPEVE